MAIAGRSVLGAQGDELGHARTRVVEQEKQQMIPASRRRIICFRQDGLDLIFGQKAQARGARSVSEESRECDGSIAAGLGQAGWPNNAQTSAPPHALGVAAANLVVPLPFQNG